ncbi:p24 complex component [Geranomyces variabilis]|uniref:P24 complex component n=1 Tax=Geranomyces variabilis TaxID=109894 RepID=A0AAD5XMV7_9FUNG|nr:p24 complex component [Geranomyces variabilis]
MKCLHFALATLAACVILSTPSAALNTFNIILGPSRENCFNEHLQAQERLDLSYEVADGGSLDVDFVIYSPNSRPLYNLNGESFATFGFNAELEGTYVYCFSNKKSGSSERKLSFSVHGPDEVFKIENKELKESVDDPTDTIQAELRTLDSGIKAIRDEQAFLVQRERRHRLTADSTNARVLYWSMVQALALIGVCYFQISYFKRFFEMGGVRV